MSSDLALGQGLCVCFFPAQSLAALAAFYMGELVVYLLHHVWEKCIKIQCIVTDEFMLVQMGSIWKIHLLGKKQQDIKDINKTNKTFY